MMLEMQVLLLVGDAEGVPVEFVVAAFDGFLGILHIVAQEAHGFMCARPFTITLGEAMYQNV